MDPLTPRAVEQIVLGVSTRKYVRSFEGAPPGHASRRTSKSAVSRRFVAAWREKLAEMMARDLSQLSLCTIMIDGIHIGGHVILVALGIDAGGEKHVLGAYEGATENTVCCAGILPDLESRVVRTECSGLEHLPEERKQSVGRTHARLARADRPRRQERCLRDRHRRAGHRQGARCTRHPLPT